MTTTTKKVPARALRFTLDAVDAVAFAAGDDKKPATFSIVANSGKPIANHWWWGNLGIELAGIKAKKRVPVLMDHDPGKRIGYSDDHEVDKKRGLVMQGQFLASSALAAQVRGESLDGFPFEASVNLRPTKIERIPEGETAEVNGHQLVGPGHIFRKSELREVSFCALGADANTSAAALADDGDATAELHEIEDMTTQTDPKGAGNPAPSPAPAVLDAARAEGANAERERIRAIRELAVPEQAALCDELIRDNATVGAAAVRLAADLKTRHATLQQQLAASSDKPLSPGNKGGGDAPPTTPLAAAQAMPDGPDKWAKLYELDPAVRAEWHSAAAFAAYQQSLPLGSRTVMPAASKP